MTPTQRKAMEMARDALQRAGYTTDHPEILGLCEQADDALRAALAEPEEYTVKVNGTWSAVLTAMMNSRTKAEPVSDEPDLSKCPNCGGPADNGHDRCIPPNPYWCVKCETHPPKREPLTEEEK